MYIEVGEHLVSTQVFEKKFICDLTACKGSCCIEGNSGAPLTLEEIDQLEDKLEKIQPFMGTDGRNAVETRGVFYMDEDNEPVTTLVNNAECAFVFFDEQGIAKCAIEKAFLEGRIDFNKPQSCHLYPIRVKIFNESQVLTFEEWDICAPACECGVKADMPVYRFLKAPISRVFGNDFFRKLEVVAEEWIKSKR